MSSIAQIMEDTHSEFESYEITTKPWIPMQLLPSLECVALSVTLASSSERPVVIGRPAWTPELPAPVPGLWSSALIRPDSTRRQVAGEILRKH